MAIIAPHFATGIIIGLAGQLLVNLNEKAITNIEKNNDFRLLDVLHHFTSGFKAYSTE